MSLTIIHRILLRPFFNAIEQENQKLGTLLRIAFFSAKNMRATLLKIVDIAWVELARAVLRKNCQPVHDLFLNVALEFNVLVAFGNGLIQQLERSDFLISRELGATFDNFLNLVHQHLLDFPVI